MSLKEKVKELWPEIEWIKDPELKEKVTNTWVYALEKSVLKPDDLKVIPFTLLAKDCKVSFMAHKRAVVHLSVENAKIMKNFFGDDIKIDMDLLIAGAILIDVGKLIEYEMKDGKAVTGRKGHLLRHPFSGASLADRFDLPFEVLHMIASHSKEGDLGKRTIEGIIVHHADFVSFEPFLEHL